MENPIFVVGNAAKLKAPVALLIGASTRTRKGGLAPTSSGWCRSKTGFSPDVLTVRPTSQAVPFSEMRLIEFKALKMLSGRTGSPRTFYVTSV